ncbi:MAG: DUF58 domain-containing protein [Treponema sp.]|nr:DUF58 domain-containing protein [Treponema sp.]
MANNDSLLKKASYLRIVARDLAEGMKSGNFRSLYRGQGIEFEGVRDYIRGDDIRSIDWNVTARMANPYVKVFEEERELQIFLVVDSSESMMLECNKKTKYSVAAESAALITIAAELNACPVGAVFFDGKIHFSCKPKTDKQNIMMILQHLDRLPEEKEKGSALASALNGAGKLLKTRSLVFVFSDFRSSEWEKPLLSLAQKNDVIAMRLHDHNDEELPKLGTVVFEDVESGIKMDLPSSSEYFKKEWKAFNNSQINLWQAFCIKHGIMPVILDTKYEPLQILNQTFAQKAKLR